MKRLLVLALLMMLVPNGVLKAQPGRNLDRRERVARISSIISDCERRTDEFKKSLARALDHSRLDGTRREDQLNKDAAVLEKAMNRLRESWNKDHDPERSRHNVGVAISAAQDIHLTLSRHALRGHVQREWDDLRGELDRLADIFHQPKIEWEPRDRDRLRRNR